MTLDNERQAAKLSESPKSVERMLRATWGQLPDHIRERFRPVWFDAPRLRLNSADMSLALQWQIRERPYDPIGKTNRQSPEGVIYLLGCNPADVRLWKANRLHFKNSPGEG